MRVIAAYEPRRLYLRWILANALAEFLGLGTTLVSVASVWAVIDRSPLWQGLLLALGVALAGGVVEGSAVGLFQWAVLRRPLPALRPIPYALATGIGAFLAWTLGMLPSTIISGMAASSAGTTAPAEPSLALQLLLAVGMGAVLGPFLGVPQWLVLRPHLPRAGWWVPANATAWSLGMPMIFLATSVISPSWSPVQIGLTVGAGVLAAGLVVGAVHGLWLLWLLDGANGEAASADVPGSRP